MVSRYQTKEPVQCYMQHCAPTHPSHQHHGHHQHHPQHHHQAHHPGPPHLNHHPHHPHHPAQHHHQSHHHHHHQASPTGPPPPTLHAPLPLPQQPPQNQPTPPQQQQAQQQPQLGNFRIVPAATAPTARSEGVFLAQQGGAGPTSMRNIPHAGPPNSLLPPHHAGALGGLGPGGGGGPQGGGGGAGGGGGGGPTQPPTPPGPSPHDMAKQGGGPANSSSHLPGQPQMPGATGLHMGFSISGQQRPNVPQFTNYRPTNTTRLLGNPRSQVMTANGVPPMYQQVSTGFQVVPPTAPIAPMFVPGPWYNSQPRQPSGYQPYPPATQQQFILSPPMLSFVNPHNPQNQFYISQMVRSGPTGANTGGGGHGGTPPQQQALQQQSTIQLQQQAVVGAGGAPGGGMPMGGGGGGPSTPVSMVGPVMGAVNVSGVVGMGGGVGQSSGQTQPKPRKHALPIVNPITGTDVIEEMLKSEENHSNASNSSSRTDLNNQDDSKARADETRAEFAAKVAKVAASTSESDSPAPQPQPSETSGGGTMTQISGSINGPSENLYSVPSENIAPSQLGMNASTEPWKQTSDKERDSVMEPSICDTVIQKTVVEPVAVIKPEPVKEEKMLENIPVAPLNVPEVLPQPTPVVSARGGIRVPSPVVPTVVSAIVKQPCIVNPPPAVPAVEASALSPPSVNLHSQTQPPKELAPEFIKHQVPPPKPMQTAAHKPASATVSAASKGNESVVTKKVLPLSREGSSERKKVHEAAPIEIERKEDKTAEHIVSTPIEEPLPPRHQLQANGDDGLDGKATQRHKQKKVQKNRELNRKGAEKEGTDMDAFSDAQLQQQRQEAAAASNSNVTVASSPAVNQRIGTPTPPPTAAPEKVVNDLGKARTITPPPTSQVPSVPAKTNSIPQTTTKSAAPTPVENVPVQINSNSSNKLEQQTPKVPSSKTGIEKTQEPSMSSVESTPIVPEQTSIGVTNSHVEEVEKEVAVEKATEDGVSDMLKVKVSDTNKVNEESTKVEKDFSTVEKVDKEEEIVAAKNSENTMASTTPEEEKKVEDDDSSNKTAVNEKDSTSTPTPVIEDVAADSSSKFKLRDIYKEDQWSPLNPQGKKKYEREFLMELKNDPQSMKKPENLPDLEIVLKDSTNRMQSRTVDFKTIGSLSRNSTQDFAPGFVKSLSARPATTKRNSQQGKSKKIVHVTISWNEDVKLHEAENAWKPRTKVPKDGGQQRKETEELYASMRGILNKLTPQNFEKLVQQVMKLPIDTMEKLRGVINLVFDKAVDEPNFSVAYAELCNYLNSQNIARQAQKSEDSNSDFRKILLKRCQTEFEKDKAAELGLAEKMKLIERETSEEKKKELRLQMEDDERRMRRKSVGVTRFIGELYKLGMINQSIMVTCIRELLDGGAEESLECLCKLLTTVGKVLEEALEKKGANPPNLNAFFSKMKAIVNERKTSSRVRFMLQDVIDLKNSKWIPRRDESNPKKIEQIAMEAERESMEQSQLAAYSPMPSRGSMGGGMSRKDDRGKSRDDWYTVQSKSSRISVDCTKLKVQAEPEDLRLGSRNHTWSRGAGGGSTSLGVSDRKQNFYNVLSNDSDSMGNAGRRVPMRHKEAGQIYTKSGSTSSVVVPPEEKERSIESIRKYFGGPSLENTRSRGGLPAKTPSRDNSVNAEDKSRESSMSNANVEHSQPKAPANLSPEEVEKLCKIILDDYLSSSNEEETFAYMRDELPVDNYINFLDSSLEKVLEAKPGMRQSFAKLVVYLIKNQLFTKQLFVEALDKLLCAAEDMLIDIPKFWDYIADILAVLFEEEALPLSSLKELTSQLNDELSGALIVAVLNLFFKKKGPGWITEKWTASSLKWTDLMKPESIEKFVKDNRLEYVTDSCNWDAFPKYGGFAMDDVKTKLCEFLKSNMNHDQIFAWIEGNIGDKINELGFIRALTTAVCESAIENNTKLKENVLSANARLLQRYVNTTGVHELQCLYAVQAFVHKMEHPKGLIYKMFLFLLDNDLISVETFKTWESSKDEPDGKAVALKSLTQFFTFLNEAEEPDSNDEI